MRFHGFQSCYMRHHEGFNITGCKIKLFVQSETKSSVPGVESNLLEKKITLIEPMR